VQTTDKHHRARASSLHSPGAAGLQGNGSTLTVETGAMGTATLTDGVTLAPAANATILGVDLGGTHVRVGRVRGGHVEHSAAASISSHERAEVVSAEIFRTIDDVFDEEVAGIGCGVPSIVDLERGIVYQVENIPSWNEVPLKDELEQRYGVPVYVNNDANAFAVGELYFGAGRGHRHMVGLTLGTGLGAGVIIDGRLYSGANCAAGELGSLPYREHTLEHYCSGAIFKHLGLRGEEVFSRARAGDAQARELYVEFGRDLGYAVLVILHAYDPELIVLGGSISAALPYFERSMHERLHSYSWPHVVERLRIAPSEVESTAILGAAALYLDAIKGDSR
jgi:glucokinase